MKKTVWLISGVALAVIASKLLVENILGINVDAAVERWLSSAGPGSAVVLITLLAVDLFLPIPSSLVMVLSGAAFGTVAGAALSLVGSIGGEWLGFELVRRYGTNASRRFVGDAELARVRQLMERHGMAAVVVSRALPVLMETMSVVAGLSAMSRWRFLGASLIGTVPITLAYAYAGAASRSVGNVAPAVIMVLAIAGGAWVWYRARVDARLSRR